MSKAVLVSLTLSFLYVATRPIDAYIDPGSTNMALQWVVGGLAAATVVIVGIWRRVVMAFRARVVEHGSRNRDTRPTLTRR